MLSSVGDYEIRTCGDIFLITPLGICFTYLSDNLTGRDGFVTRGDNMQSRFLLKVYVKVSRLCLS